MSKWRITAIPKEYRKLVKRALDEGWELTYSRSGHPKLTAPDGYATPIPSSSRHPRLVKAIEQRIDRGG